MTLALSGVFRFSEDAAFFLFRPNHSGYVLVKPKDKHHHPEYEKNFINSLKMRFTKLFILIKIKSN